MKSWMTKTCLAAAAAMFLAATAQASVVPTLELVTPGAAPGTFTFTYEVTLTPDQRLDVDNDSSEIQFLTIYDFAGYVAGSANVIGTPFSFSSANLGEDGPDSPLPLSADNPALPNLTFSFTDATPIVGPQTYIVSVDSIYSSTTLDAFLSVGTKNTSLSELEDGTLAINKGFVSVPQSGGPIVPEPASMLLLGTGLTGLAILGRRKFAK